MFKKQNQYYAKFNDVSNLLISSPIYVRVSNWFVSDIKMISSDPMNCCRYNLTENLPIPISYLEYGTDVFGASQHLENRIFQMLLSSG